jgi:predicted nucleotidyltransferase component of viral defense system
LLYRETVEESTFHLLDELMNFKPLREYSLVGGTALSLQLGHRISEDLDLFILKNFDKAKMQVALKRKFKDRIDIHSSVKNPLGVFSHIDGIKIDIVKHPYPLINDILVVDNIRMWSLLDIAASKVYAISIRATKKDFWDIDRLLDIFNVEEIADAYYKRYKQFVALGVPKMLTYFSEADESKDPVCLMRKDWKQVQKSISKKINDQLK